MFMPAGLSSATHPRQYCGELLVPPGGRPPLDLDRGSALRDEAIVEGFQADVDDPADRLQGDRDALDLLARPQPPDRVVHQLADRAEDMGAGALQRLDLMREVLGIFI